MKLQKRLVAFLLMLTLVVPLLSAAATQGTVRAAVEGPIVLSNGETKELCEVTKDRYAVLSGNLKVDTELGEDNWTNVQFWLEGNSNASTMQVLWLTNSQYFPNREWEIKVPAPVNRLSAEGVNIAEDQKQGADILKNVRGTSGLDFKIVRLNDWAYFLAKDVDGKYKVVGKMNGMNSDTKIVMSAAGLASGGSVTLSDGVVKIGRDNVMAELAGSKISVSSAAPQQSNDAVYFPFRSTEWTFEAKVTTIAEAGNTAVYVGPGPGGDETLSNGWKYGLGVVTTNDGKEIRKPGAETGTALPGEYVRWVRSGSKLSVYASADGIKWSQTPVAERTDVVGFNGMFVNGSQAELSEIKMNTEESIVLTNGQRNELCGATSDRYAVLSGNLKVDTVLGEDNWTYVEFGLVGKKQDGFSAMQVLWLTNSQWFPNHEWEIKVGHGSNRSNAEGVGIAMDQLQGADILKNVREASGLDFKIVRLNDWAYFLAKDTDGGYKVVGKMNGITGDTNIVMNAAGLAEGGSVTLSDYEVATGRGNVMAALADSKISVSSAAPQQSTDAVYFPLGSTEWTFEAKVDTRALTKGTAVYVGPGPRGDENSSYGWTQGLGVIKTTKGDKIGKPGETTGLALSGEYVRWVRSGSKLFVYNSSNGSDWTLVTSRNDLDTRLDGMFVNGSRAELSEIKMSTQDSIVLESTQTKELCSPTSEKYVVVRGNLKVNPWGEKDTWTNVEFRMSGTGDHSTMQVMWYNGGDFVKDGSPWGIKVPQSANVSQDEGVTLKQAQVHSPSVPNEADLRVPQEDAKIIGKIKEADGLNFKLVRLNDWVYFLAQDANGVYKVVGKMNAVKADTNIVMTVWNGTATLSSYAVETGKENVLMALADSRISVSSDNPQQSSDAVYFPAGGTEWTFEAKVDTKAEAGNTAVYVGPGPGGDGTSSYGWTQGLGVVTTNGGKEIREPGKTTGNTFTGNYVRWVRSGSKLSVYASEDGTTWSETPVAERTGLGENLGGMFVNGAGAELSNIQIALAKSTVVAAQAIVGEKITMKFFMNFPAGTPTDARIEYTLPDMSSTKGQKLVSGLTDGTYNGEPCKVFSCDVAAKEMARDITFKVVTSSGSQGEELKYNVKTYAETIIKGNYSDAEKAMAKAMLNYGGYAQKYFAFDPDNLANKDIDSKLGTVSIEDSYKATVSNSNVPEGLTYYGTSLMTTSDTAIRHYFKLDAGAGKSISDFEFKCGKTTLTPVEKRDGYYYVEISGIKAAELSQMYTLTINGADVVVYGPYTYIKAVVEGSYSEELTNLVKALYHYSKAAEDLSLSSKKNSQ